METLGAGPEFVVSDGPQGERFVATAGVVASLVRLLAHGKVDEAVELLGQCQEDVGDDLLEDAKLASRATQQHLLETFVRARDFRRAAVCVRWFGEWERMGDLCEAGLLFDEAAAAYMKAGRIEKAANALERGHQYVGAAELHLKGGHPLRAAECLERAGDAWGAARLYLAHGRSVRAVEVLQRIGPADPNYVPATLLLAEVLEKAGRGELAKGILRGAIRKKGRVAESLVMCERFAGILEREGQKLLAARVVEQALAISPGRPDLEERLARLRAEAAGGPRGEGDAGAGEEPDGEGAERGGAVAVMETDLGPLRSVPLFAPLGLPELRAFLQHWEKASFESGAVVIEKGEPGTYLYVIASGRAGVWLDGEGRGRPMEVLAKGSAFGEMSFLEDHPAVAKVAALDPLDALRIPNSRLRSILAANDRLAARVLGVLARTLSERLRKVEDPDRAAPGGRP